MSQVNFKLVLSSVTHLIWSRLSIPALSPRGPGWPMLSLFKDEVSAPQRIQQTDGNPPTHWRTAGLKRVLMQQLVAVEFSLSAASQPK